jgi:hypothetical protein
MSMIFTERITASKLYSTLLQFILEQCKRLIANSGNWFSHGPFHGIFGMLGCPVFRRVAPDNLCWHGPPSCSCGTPYVIGLFLVRTFVSSVVRRLASCTEGMRDTLVTDVLL